MTIEIISTPIEATVTLTPPAAPVGSVTVTDPSAPAEIIAVTNPAAPSVITIEQAARAAELITVGAPPEAAISVEDRRVHAQITIHADGEGPGVDLDRMIHPAYPDTVKAEFAGGVRVVAGVVTVFERTLEYDAEDRIIQVQTDDLTGTARLLKTITYDSEDRATVRREITIWQ